MKNIKLFVVVCRGKKVKLIHPDKKEKGWIELTSFEEKKKWLKHTPLYGINEHYILFEDGTVWSEYTKKFIRIHRQKTKEHHKSHFSVVVSTGIRIRKGIQLSRLIFFYFGEHQYQNIDEVPLLSFKDGDTGNLNVENLYITNATEIARRSRLNRPSDFRSIISDTEDNISFVKESLKKYPGNLKRIAEHFGCSSMSVLRFIRRNKIPYKSKYKSAH